MAPRAPSSKPPWATWMPPDAAELEEVAAAVLVLVPDEPAEVAVTATEVLLMPEALAVALTRMTPVPET